MYLLSKLAWVLLKPFNLFLLALITGGTLAAWTGGRLRRLGQWIFAFALVTMVGLNIVPVGERAVLALENRFPVLASLPDQVDGIIVLGGVIKPSLTKIHGTISLNGSADRLWAGLELARKLPQAKFVYTGGNSLPIANVPDEADLAERAYKAAGLDGPRMMYERKSRNTRENAVFTKALIRPQPGEVWLLVTSAAHMPRAVGCFRAVGWPVTPYPVDFTTGGETDPVVGFSMVRPFSRLGQASKEWLGLAYYYFRGWTNVLYPAPVP